MANKTVSKILSDWLDSYLNFEKLPVKNIFWLDTIEFLCERFNNPQNAYRSIHIAGSKGKGSVSTFVSSILTEAAYSCGLYTSPHITELTERISLSGKQFPESVYEKAFKEMVCRVESIIPEQLPNGREITWFELVTLFGFLCFRQADVDWAVFETGLGGRLDATNVLKPELCILTPIELEHTEFLGDTIPLIAGEKAGIIKEGTPVFVSLQKPEALEVFRKKAAEKNAPLFYAGDFIKKLKWSYKNVVDPVMHVDIEYDGLFSRPLSADLKLLGEVQAQNAALAAAAVRYLLPDISEETIEKGLSAAVLPGRFEITGNPCGNTTAKLVLDGAHTVNSVTSTLKTFSSIFSGPAELIFGCAADKDMKSLVNVILGGNCPFSRITLTRPGEVKKSDLGTLSELFIRQLEACPELRQKLTYVIEPDYRKAIKEAVQKAAENGSTLLATGSFYLVSEMKSYLSSKSFLNS